MAKKIRFPLEMENGVEVRSLEELQNNFSLEKVMGYYINGRLNVWLRDRYMDEMAIKIAELDKNKDNFAEKLCEVFGVEYQQSEINMEELENKNKRLAKIKEYTENESILQNIGNVALNQDELYERLDEGKIKIYLCGERFEIPLSKRGIHYIGVNMPTVVISALEEVDFDELEIQFEGIEFDEQYKKIMVPDIEKSKALYKDEQYEKAIGIFEKQAEKGNAEAMRYLGMCYEYGDEVEPDLQKAFEWYKKGAEAGDPGSMNNVGVCYSRGEGTQEDERKAVEWYKKGAEAGEMYAMSNLAYRYLKGLGTSHDWDKAMYWYEKSAELGNPRAMGHLAYELWRSDPDKTLYWAKKGAAHNDERSIHILVVSYKRSHQFDKVFSLLEPKAKEGDVRAMLTLADWYYSSNVAIKSYQNPNPEKSLYWLKKAAEAGDCNAINKVSDRYECGSHGVAENKAEAARWRARANSTTKKKLWQNYEIQF